MEPLESHRSRLVALARGWLGDHADAEDAVQDAYLRAGTAMPAELRSPAAWLVTVVRHACMDRLRRRQRERRGHGDGFAAEVHAPSAEHTAALLMEAEAATRRMAQRLRPDDAAAALLHAVFDFEHGEISRLAGESEPAVRQRVSRALRRLREAVDAGEERAPSDRAATEALFSMCWRALVSRNPAGLIAQLQTSRMQRQPAVGVSMLGSASPLPARRSAAPSTTAALVQLEGALALALSLDGVLLCVLPLGPLAPAEALADAEA
ncbi:MAG TPA: RNA polymerase sigma factor [Ideonella sp.]|nr:RNA polymerase sigma factor [Ideonella sp.]